MLERHEEILHKVSEEMMEIIHDQANACISLKHQKARQAQQALEETVEREKAHLNESLEAFKSFAREKSLNHFTLHLQQMEKHAKGLMHTMTQKIHFLAEQNKNKSENEGITGK